MGTPAHKGLRDYENPFSYSFTTITLTNTTSNTSTICTEYFTHQLGTGESTKTCTTNVVTSTTPTTSVVPTFTKSTETKTNTICLTCPPTIKTKPPVGTSTGTGGGGYTFTEETWRSLKVDSGGGLEQEVPWLPIGLGGLAKWYMADKGDPSFGVKKRIHVMSDNVAEHKGGKEKNGVLEAGVRPLVYENFFKNGKFLNATMSNERYVGQGMEGFISASFIWRYNVQNPTIRVFEPLLDKFSQYVDGVVYPTGWIRVKIRGLKVNNSGEIVAISLVTKYGTGDTASYGLQENLHDGSVWTGTKSVLTENAQSFGFEGHTEVIELSNLWDHSDKQIFHFFNDPEKNAVDENAIASSLTTNVPSNFSYPLSAVAGVEESGASNANQNKVHELVRQSVGRGLTPDTPRVDLEENLRKSKLHYDSSTTIRIGSLAYNDPTEDAVPNTKPSDNKDYILHELLPHMFRISSDAGNGVQYSSSTFPYKKTFLINGVEVTPKFRLTKFLRSDKEVPYGDLYLRKPVARNVNGLMSHVMTYWEASDRYTWTLDTFGTTDNTQDPILQGFDHDEVSARTHFREVRDGSGWTTGGIHGGAQIKDFYIKGIKNPLNGYSIEIAGVLSVPIGGIRFANNFADKAYHPMTSAKATSAEAVYVFEFLTS